MGPPDFAISNGDGGVESPLRPYGALLWQSTQSKQRACCPTRGPTLRFGSPRYGVATGHCDLRVASNTTIRNFGQGRRRCALALSQHLHSALLVNGAGVEQDQDQDLDLQDYSAFRPICQKSASRREAWANTLTRSSKRRSVIVLEARSSRWARAALATCWYPAPAYSPIQSR